MDHLGASERHVESSERDGDTQYSRGRAKGQKKNPSLLFKRKCERTLFFSLEIDSLLSFGDAFFHSPGGVIPLFPDRRRGPGEERVKERRIDRVNESR